MIGSYLIPSQLPGEHAGHKAVSRHSEPFEMHIIPSLAVTVVTHFTYPVRDGGLSQPPATLSQESGY